MGGSRRIPLGGEDRAGAGSYAQLASQASRGGARMQYPPVRRGELDLLRAVVVLGLVFFHTAVIFGAGEFPVKAGAENRAATVFLAFGSTWGMPLLFVVSGMGIWYSLRSRSARAFARCQLLRRLLRALLGRAALARLPVRADGDPRHGPVRDGPPVVPGLPAGVLAGAAARLRVAAPAGRGPAGRAAGSPAGTTPATRCCSSTVTSRPRTPGSARRSSGSGGPPWPWGCCCSRPAERPVPRRPRMATPSPTPTRSASPSGSSKASTAGSGSSPSLGWRAAASSVAAAHPPGRRSAASLSG